MPAAPNEAHPPRARASRLCAALLGLAALSSCRGDKPAPSKAEAKAKAKTTSEAKAQPPGERAKDPPPPPCGRIAFASPLDEERNRVLLVPSGGGPSVPVTPLGEEDPRSEYPAGTTPDGRALLILRAEPTPSGKTRDALGLVALGDPAAVFEAREPVFFGPSEVMLRNPSVAPSGEWLVVESDAASFRDLYRVELPTLAGEASEADDAGEGEGPSAPLRLTDNREGNFEPTVSPDGARIAFASSRDGDAEIYVMSSDGGGPRRLSESPGDDTAPLWSPDGARLAFTSARSRERGIDVYLMTMAGEGDGGEAIPALRAPARDRKVIARDLAFSPDGRRLAFTELDPKQGEAAIVVVEVADGRELLRTEPESVDQQPSWSPDGNYLVFARSHASGFSDIIRVRLDGRDPTQLSDGQGKYWLPRWIPEPGCARAEAPEPTERPARDG